MVARARRHRRTSADRLNLAVSLLKDPVFDAFLTGEPKHETFYESFERGVSSLFAGHYMTETVGVKLLAEKLAAEVIAASKGEGNAVKKKEDTHRMAEANKAFAHYRW